MVSKLREFGSQVREAFSFDGGTVTVFGYKITVTKVPEIPKKDEEKKPSKENKESEKN